MMSIHSTSSPASAQRFADALLADVDGAQAVVLATIDGLALAHARRREVDVERLSALVSSLAALGAAAGKETHIGQLRALVVESTLGRLVTRSVSNEQLVIAVLTDAAVPLGLVWTHLRQAEAQLAGA
jgi:predicted regulator of Ras-like GTPase activity (Roadblock/LC7/MglB family)